MPAESKLSTRHPAHPHAGGTGRSGVGAGRKKFTLSADANVVNHAQDVYMATRDRYDTWSQFVETALTELVSKEEHRLGAEAPPRRNEQLPTGRPVGRTRHDETA